MSSELKQTYKKPTPYNLKFDKEICGQGISLSEAGKIATAIEGGEDYRCIISPSIARGDIASATYLVGWPKK